ncbi:hypothetical protein D918_08315 [Trichuris suis]|nr:hypothetical protein D918_08315 [Trichuris suis]
MMLLIFQLHDQTRASCKALNIISNSACIHQVRFEFLDNGFFLVFFPLGSRIID